MGKKKKKQRTDIEKLNAFALSFEELFDYDIVKNFINGGNFKVDYSYITKTTTVTIEQVKSFMVIYRKVVMSSDIGVFEEAMRVLQKKYPEYNIFFTHLSGEIKSDAIDRNGNKVKFRELRGHVNEQIMHASGVIPWLLEDFNRALLMLKMWMSMNQLGILYYLTCKELGRTVLYSFTFSMPEKTYTVQDKDLVKKLYTEWIYLSDYQILEDSKGNIFPRKNVTNLTIKKADGSKELIECKDGELNLTTKDGKVIHRKLTNISISEKGNSNEF